MTSVNACADDDLIILTASQFQECIDASVILKQDVKEADERTDIIERDSKHNTAYSGAIEGLEFRIKSFEEEFWSDIGYELMNLDFELMDLDEERHSVRVAEINKRIKVLEAEKASTQHYDFYLELIRAKNMLAYLEKSWSSIALDIFEEDFQATKRLNQKIADVTASCITGKGIEEDVRVEICNQGDNKYAPMCGYEE
ncbi:hypothetical protein TUM4644_16580 [Shewanella colwelliana]|uniref:Uncharacterized protein n=2 Tax=Shewanella colwelliana TaxID=23 RepID=A0ABQ4NUY7_SHECO|nr:hypothetical protein TUM4644_16580 [Shewanella colwelliana]GIU36039.1 hypothetical protein TUM3794_04580 [Shewanella colwelliana]